MRVDLGRLLLVLIGFLVAQILIQTFLSLLGINNSNISIIKDGAVRTAPADSMILAGVARAHLIKVCKKFGIPVIEEPYTLDELMNADEVIVTSSGTLCRPVSCVDGIEVGGKAPELLKLLQDELMRDYLEKTE